jgi:uncharacterized membrane protein YkoI
MRNLIISVVVIGVLVIGVFGCQSGHKIKLSQVSEQARATIEKLTSGGQITMIEKEISDGKTIYDFEATVNGKNVEYDIAESGEILTSEESVPYSTLPAEVKQATEKYFGSAEGLSASKEIEENKTYYEVEGKKSGKVITLKLDETGKIVEEEKEEEE